MFPIKLLATPIVFVDAAVVTDASGNISDAATDVSITVCKLLLLTFLLIRLLPLALMFPLILMLLLLMFLLTLLFFKVLLLLLLFLSVLLLPLSYLYANIVVITFLDISFNNSVPVTIFLF